MIAISIDDQAVARARAGAGRYEPTIAAATDTDLRLAIEIAAYDWLKARLFNLEIGAQVELLDVKVELRHAIAARESSIRELIPV